MSSHLFRECDIRGVADRDLPDPVVVGIGRGLAERLRPVGRDRVRVVVSRDCRLSGARLFSALCQGLIQGGADVVDVGIGPTPQLYFAVEHLAADGGVMITGSHNPKEENGFKIMRGTSSMHGPELQRLAAQVASANFDSSRRSGTLTEYSVAENYLNALTHGFDIDPGRFRFVVDAGNGAAGPLGCEALRRVGVEPIALYCAMDGTFPNHHPDPTEPEALQALIKAVRETGAIVGLAWDGDGDRLGVVDQSGDVIWGDRLLTLFARSALRQHPGGTIIGDVKCSQALFDDINAQGGKAIMWKTGHALIKAKLNEEQALMAGEMSGHFFFADRYFGFDDAIYAALRLIEIITQGGKSVKELLSDLPEPCSTPELRLDCPDDIKFEVVEQVKQHFLSEGETVVDLDGARVLYQDGAWGLVRASNTSPKLVLRFEGPTHARVSELSTLTHDVVAKARDNIQHA